MKQGSFKCLLMREYFMARKSLKLNLLTFVVVASLGILIALSKQYGNLALIVDLLSEKDFKVGMDSIDMWIRLMPAFFGIFIATVTMDSVERDDAFVWRCFRKTTPAGSFRFALAKTIFVLFVTLLSLVCIFVYMALVGEIVRSYATEAEIGIILFFLLLVLCLNVMGMTFSSLFHSMDKGGIFTVGFVMVGIVLAGLVIGYEKLELLSEEMNEIQDLYELVKGFLPYIPFAFVLLFGVLLCAMTFLYQRREA